tara:strand:- start:228 stop:1175 length:948 start_codon:yes stop_codon:yes gene_type:complete
LKRSLVAGGAGFIGSHLCERLLSEGHSVVCVDNLCTGSKVNLASFGDDSQFQFVQADVTGQFEFENEFDHIWHMASPASPPRYMELPMETALANTVGTSNLIKLAVESNATFLFASTSEVYGDPLEHPQVEEYRGNVDTRGDRACYDEGKRFGETLSYIAQETQGLDARIVRIFNTYGPRMDPRDGRAMVDFIVRSLLDEPLRVFGDGSQTRSFCYVDDMVEGLFRAGTMEAARGCVINLGSPWEMTILQLAELILEIRGVDLPIEYGPLPDRDPVRRRPDITQARNVLGWQPNVAPNVGIPIVVEWMSTRLKTN